MSDVLRIGFIVEGRTDYEVLKAVTLRFTDGQDFVAVRIQPPDDAVANDQGEFGGGRKGVRSWCTKVGEDGGPFASSAFENFDVLVIHVDADVAREDELVLFDLARDCPPPAASCDRVRAYFLGLLGPGESLARVVMCVPSQNMEAWVFAALHPTEVSSYAPFECRNKPETLLIGRPQRLVRSKDGTAKKDTRRYRVEAHSIAQGWAEAAAACTQAARYEAEMKGALMSCARTA